MRKLLFYTFLLLCLACSSSDDTSNTNTQNTSTFEVAVTQDANTVNVDQIVTLTATANQTINEISYSTDGGLTFPSSHSSNFSDTANMYFSFDTLGEKTIVFRVKNTIGDIVDNTITINVERGNALQLQNIQLNSFFNMGNTWDSEYPTSNPNHLADVFFVILKPPLNVYTGLRASIPSSSWVWYTSEVRDNEVNLNWDFQNEEVYINVGELSPYISFADKDAESVGDIMLGPPFERVIPLLNYQITQPSSILIQEADINLEYEISIDW